MKFIITEEEKNHIRNLYDLINEGTVEDYLQPSTTTGTESFIGYLKTAGVTDVLTFKKNCLSQENCFFSKKEIKKLTPLLNDKWDALADKCWACYGGPLTNNIRTNDTTTKKIEELKPYCQNFKVDEDGSSQCDYKFSGQTRINLIFSKLNDIQYAHAYGLIEPDFLNDPNNQQIVNTLKPYGRMNPGSNLILNKEIKDLTPIIQMFKTFKTV